MEVLTGLYLQVHLGQADEHPGDEALPEPCRDEAHLEEPLERVIGPLLDIVQVHGWFGRKEVRQQVTMATRKNNKNNINVDLEEPSCRSQQRFCTAAGLEPVFLCLFV